MCPLRHICGNVGMPLKSNIAINGKRPAGLPLVLGVEPLSEDDLGKLAETRGVKPLPIKRLSDRHHKLARAVASGKSTSECAIESGLEPSRVSVLKNDPTFKDLVEYYRTRVSGGEDLFLREADGLLFDSTTEMRRRVEEEPETLSTDELIRMSAFAADRTGRGPARKEEKNVNFNFGDRLEAARRRVIESEMRDITPEEVE